MRVSVARRSYIAVVAMVGTVVACSSTALQTPDYDAVDKWLTCEECVDGERAAVVARGSAVVPVLRQTLLYLPPVREQAIVRRQAEQAYATLNPAGVTLQDYVEPVFNNYVALRQVRAAMALADIARPMAVSALDEALSPMTAVQYRADVARTLQFLRTVALSSPFTGAVAPRSVALGDTVVVHARPRFPFTTQAIAALESSPFAASALLLWRNDDSLAFAAAATAGSHAVAIIDSGSSAPASVFTVAIVSQTDRNDRGMRSCTTVVCQVDSAQVISAATLPYLAFLSLSRAGVKADTIDFFRIQPAAPLAVTARLDWTGPANLDLRWRTCSTFLPVGNLAGATSTNNPEATSVTIPAGQCWVLMLMLGPYAVASPPVFARLRVTIP